MATRRILLPTLIIALIADYTQSFAAYAAHGQSFLSERPSLSGVKQVLEHRPSTALSQCNMSGPIETTQCDYETLESINDDLHENLHELIDLSRDCPYWEANGYCVLRDCAVTTVDETDIPEAWRTECLSRLDRSPTDELRKTLPGCYYRDSDFCVLDDDESKDGEYVDLTLNPERFTGYSGPAAHRIWEAIYDENCFGISEADFHASIGKQETDLLTTSPFGTTPAALSPLVHQAHEVEKETCLEKRVFYRIISGLHASISTHLCKHNFDQRTGTWSPNLQCFIDRIASHPERLQYIYFNAVLLLRAVARAGPYLAAYDIYTGVGSSGDVDKVTSRLMHNVISTAKNVLKEEFKVHFRNITRIMDCVGCDKCRLWGKIQTSGIGTALKILFELDEKALDPAINPDLLQRSEVVTLVNTLHQLSESLQSVNVFRRIWAEKDGVSSSPHIEVPVSLPSATRAEVGLHELTNICEPLFDHG
ncbi:hypothetical protein FRB96_000885 [Tulasnella sp. 330]|nr:hypothetical protein FRB96_000885 [Tulasnella sp. 330]KAG8882705.1 hypothetical protein FRB97_007845 [Tulasnella sp. 331]